MFTPKRPKMATAEEEEDDDDNGELESKEAITRFSLSRVAARR